VGVGGGIDPAAAGLAMQAQQAQLQKAIEKEMADQQRLADKQPKPADDAGGASKAPPAHLWPLPLKRWVEKCFLLCRTSLERSAMQKQVQAVIERAAEDEMIDAKEWDKEPVPSRKSDRDRKRNEMFSSDEYDERRERGNRDRDRDRDRDRRDNRDRDGHRDRRDYDHRGGGSDRDRSGYRAGRDYDRGKDYDRRGYR